MDTKEIGMSDTNKTYKTVRLDGDVLEALEKKADELNITQRLSRLSIRVTTGNIINFTLRVILGLKVEL